MEIKKTTAVAPTATEISKTKNSSATSSTASASVWDAQKETSLGYSLINPVGSFATDENDLENESSDMLDEINEKAEKEGRTTNIFDMQKAADAKIETARKQASLLSLIPGSNYLTDLQKPVEKTQEAILEELIEQQKTQVSFLEGLAENGITLTKGQKLFLKNIRPLLSKLRKGKITVAEYQKQKKNLLAGKIIKEQKEIIPQNAKTLSAKQLEEIKNIYEIAGKTDVVVTQVAVKHAKDKKQKEEIQLTFVEDAPNVRTEMVEKAAKELPKTLDEESVKKYVKASEPLEKVERCYAAAIIENADYLTKEEKEEKLKVIGRNAQEIKQITEQNTEHLIKQIIEERKEEVHKQFTENHKLQIEHQEELKSEHKIKDTKKICIENKENNLKEIISHLLDVLKEACRKDKHDKKSQAKAEQAKYMKNNIEDELSEIQSKKRLLEKEMEMNERYTTLAIMNMEDDYLRNSSALFV